MVFDYKDLDKDLLEEDERKLHFAWDRKGYQKGSEKKPPKDQEVPPAHLRFGVILDNKVINEESWRGQQSKENQRKDNDG